MKKVRFYDLGILVVLLMGFIAASGAADDAGHPINCKRNPAEVQCLDYSKLNK